MSRRRAKAAGVPLIGCVGHDCARCKARRAALNKVERLLTVAIVYADDLAFNTAMERVREGLQQLREIRE